MRTRLVVLLLCALFGGVAQAGMVTFRPSDPDLADLDHSTYWKWGLQWSLPAGEYISGATLAITAINDWQVENNDHLYIHLLDTCTVGLRMYADSDNGSDAFAGKGILLATYVDDDTGSNPAEDWLYTFTSDQVATLTQYVSDGNFGFGLDPDCHYYNDGVTFTIMTGQVPEPATGLLALTAAAYAFKTRRGRANLSE